LSTPNLHSSPFANQRRSQRILLAVHILVSGKRETGTAFLEHTSTLTVNAHGAMIHLQESVRKGQRIKLRNVATGDELDCMVVDVNLGAPRASEVAIEFVEPNPRFWRVSFPPADWTPRSPEAKRFSPAPTPAPRPAQLPAAKK
jgi:hypothetical protein